MYRARTVFKLKPDGWNGALENVRRVNEIAKQRGWRQATVWTQTFGPFNEIAPRVRVPRPGHLRARNRGVLRGRGAMKLALEARQYMRSDDMGFNEIWQRAETVSGAD